jgi:Bacterial PH domain
VTEEAVVVARLWPCYGRRGNNRKLLKRNASSTDEGFAMAPETRRYVSTVVLTTRVVFGTTLLIIGLAALLQQWNNARTAGVIACAGGICDLVAALRAGIWIDARGITARGTLRTRRLAWADIASFSMDGSAGWATKCLRIHLRNGEAMKINTILKPRFGPKAKYQPPIVEELNDALATATIPARPDAR